MREPERDESATFDPQPRPPIGGHRALRRPGRPTLRPTLLAAALALASLQPAAAGDIRIDGSFVSTAPTGTPPLSVASTTRVDGLNADLLDGLDASAFSPAPDRVLVVSPSGGHFASVQAALDSITDAGSSKRYLIQVAPGVYSEQVTMKPFVDIAGSGQGLTILQGFGNATVVGASNAELRDLTVENLGSPPGDGTGIHAPGAATRIVRVTVRVSVSPGTPVGILMDGSPPPPGPLLRHVTVSASGPQATGVKNMGALYRLFDSEVTATGFAARAVMNGVGSIATLARVQVAAFSGGADTQAVNAVWSLESELSMVDVEARSVGGSSSTAVSNRHGTSRAKLIRLRATAIGALTSDGVANLETAMDLVDSEVVASGATTANRALLLHRSDARIYRSTLTASGTASTIALRASEEDPGGTGSPGPWAVEVHASQLWGQTTLVSNDSKFDTRIGASWLGGGGSLVNSGTLVCAGVYDDGFTFYADTCP